jgi:hypothetical protein
MAAILILATTHLLTPPSIYRIIGDQINTGFEGEKKALIALKLFIVVS